MAESREEKRDEGEEENKVQNSELPSADASKDSATRGSRLRRRQDTSGAAQSSIKQNTQLSAPSTNNTTSAAASSPTVAPNASRVPQPLEQRTFLRSFADSLSSLRLGFLSPLPQPQMHSSPATQILAGLRRSYAPGGSTSLLDSVVPHIHICRLSSLGGDLGKAVRPFVRMHVVDIRSGAYWRGEGSGSSVAAEGAVSPQCTRQAQLKGTPSDIPLWNYDMPLLRPESGTRLRLMDMLSEHCLILFEVLDDPPGGLLSGYGTGGGAAAGDVDGEGNQQQFVRLGWSFLRPIGILGSINVGAPVLLNQLLQTSATSQRSEDATNVVNPMMRAAETAIKADESLRLQLYEFQDETTVTSLQRLALGWPSSPQKMIQRYPDGVPEVYMQWRRQQHSKIESLLHIRTGMRVVPDISLRAGEAVTAGGGAGTTDAGDGPKLSSAKEEALRTKLRAAILKRTKANQEVCVPPNRLLHRLNVGREGAMVVAFSNKGHLLAVGGYVGEADVIRVPGHTLPFSGSLFGIALFDPDTGVRVWSDDRAHFGMVYELKWSQDDSYLLSCSSDGCCRVWNMKPLLGAHNVLHAGEVAEQSAKVSVIANLAHSPAVYVYTAIFQEYGTGAAVGAQCPRIFTGGEDGKIRVWQLSEQLGELSIPAAEGGAVSTAITPHQGKVHSLVIDVRSRYLLSGDSMGCILIWRTDASGWYQLLRKFRKDDVPGTSVTSLSIHPDRAKGKLLVLEQPYPGIVFDKPAVTSSAVGSSNIASPVVRLYDLSSYRVLTTFAGIEVPAVFCRTAISADGRFVLVPTASRNSSGGTSFSFQMRDAMNGNIVPCDAAAASMLHPIRSIAWHPRQHMIALAMVGSGSAVMIFCANKDNVQAAVRRMGRSGGDNPPSEATVENDTASHTGTGTADSQPTTHPGKAAQESEKESVKELRAAKTREILEKIRNAKAQNSGISK